MIDLNFAFYLSLILAVAGCSGLLLAGKGKWYGWGIGLAVQPVWAIFAYVSGAYGLFLTCWAYGTVYTLNLIKWRKDQAHLFESQYKQPSIQYLFCWCTKGKHKDYGCLDKAEIAGMCIPCRKECRV